MFICYATLKDTIDLIFHVRKVHTSGFFLLFLTPTNTYNNSPRAKLMIFQVETVTFGLNGNTFGVVWTQISPKTVFSTQKTHKHLH